ncbi:MAG: hypothetical protein ACTMIR_05510 [Cellulomonadaceae bacterium]
MRTTVTLTPESESLVRTLMHERGLTFKEAVNAAIVRGLKPEAHRVETPTFALGRARTPVDRALELAAELEDAALAAKRELGK